MMILDTDSQNSTPIDGLWAYHQGRLHIFFFELTNRKVDHVSWFRSLGLPDFGSDFDRVLRGRMTWDQHLEQWVLSFYGAHYLPNHIYEQVTRQFNGNGARVIEKRLHVWH